MKIKEKYNQKENLPDQIKDNLPTHAEEIYQKAHDKAVEEYSDPSKRRGDSSNEEVAHKVAWSAVKSKYKKDSDGRWVPR